MTPPAPAPASARAGELDKKQVVAATRAIILVGNPNVGKSALFGALTGKYVTVSNYPGTTVEVTRGSATIEGQPWHVMDTPGTNNLTPMSEDEQATRDILLTERGYSAVQVCDAKNLRRGLLLATQLAEAEIPFTLALNMADEAASRGIRIDVERLSRELGVDVVPTVAVQRQGLTALQQRIDAGGRASPFRPRYDAPIEAAIAEIAPLMPKGGIGPRALAVMALVGDESLRPHVAAHVAEADLARIDAIRRSVAARYPESLRFVIARQRLAAADRLHDAVVTRGGASAASGFGRKLGGWSTHPLWGIPILAAVLYAAYEFVGVLGAGTLVDFLENTVFAKYLVPWITAGGALPRAGRTVRELPRRTSGRRTTCSTTGSSSGSTGSSRWGSVVRHRDRPADRDDVLHRVQRPRGLGLPAAPRRHAEQGVQADGPQRQGGLADGARARLRHDGDDDRAHHGDAEGAGHRDAPPRARGPVQRADGGHLRDDLQAPDGRDGLVRRDRRARASSSSAGSPRRCSRGAARTSCWSCPRSASRRPATSR